MRLSELMKKLRTEKGLSQAKLTKDICPQSTYGSFEAGGFSISPDTLFQLVDRMNLQLDEFQALVNDGPSEKKQLIDRLQMAFTNKNQKQLAALSTYMRTKYEETNDIFWLGFSIRASELLAKAEGSFTPQGFSEAYKQDFARLENYLIRSSNWHRFEFALYGNLIPFLSSTLVMRMLKELPQKIDLTDRRNQELYIKIALNVSLYLTDIGEYQQVKNALPLVHRLIANEKEWLHWKILTLFLEDFCEEALTGNKPVSKYAYLKIYDLTGFADFHVTMKNFRKRVLKANEKSKKGGGPHESK